MKHINFLTHTSICLLLCLCCCSCGFFGDQEYYCEIDDVKSVSIIRLDEYIDGEYRFDYTVLREIPDKSTFVERLNNVSHSVNWGDPGALDIDHTVIRIDYLNGDFDLLQPTAQWFNVSGVNNYGYFFFDKEQFTALVSEYLT